MKYCYITSLHKYSQPSVSVDVKPTTGGLNQQIQKADCVCQRATVCQDALLSTRGTDTGPCLRDTYTLKRETIH